MSRAEIESLGEFRKLGFDIELYSTFLGQPVFVGVGFDEDDPKSLSDNAVNCINAFLSLDKKHKDWIHDEIWKACLMAHESFTAPHNGETKYYSLEENLSESEISTKEDAIRVTKAHSVYIKDDWELTNGDTFFYLNYKCAWDDEHQLTFYFKNGESYGVD